MYTGTVHLAGLWNNFISDVILSNQKGKVMTKFIDEIIKVLQINQIELTLEYKDFF